MEEREKATGEQRRAEERTGREISAAVCALCVVPQWRARVWCVCWLALAMLGCALCGAVVRHMGGGAVTFAVN